MNEGHQNPVEVPERDSVPELRLMALLHNLVLKHGRMEASEVLGVNYKTLAACMETGRLSGRMADALERLLMAGEAPAAIRDRERMHALEHRVNALESELLGGLKENRQAIGAGMRRLSDEWARATAGIERRLDRWEAQWGGWTGDEIGGAIDEAAAGPPPPSLTDPSKKGVVYADALPGEAAVYGPAMPAIREWRRLRRDHPDGGRGLEWISVEARLLELEILMLGELGLTLPPETEPVRGFRRTDQVAWRRRALDGALRERAKQGRIRLALRALTLGLWRK